MILKQLDTVTKEDIDNLVENSVPEGRTIEYKRTLPGNNDEERREFLADVSSFANASGGDLVYGLAEANGVASEATGVSIDDPDAECQRLDNMIRTGIAPRIPAQVRPIPGFEENRHIVIIRIPKSWFSPHMVTFNNLSRFFTRNSNGKHQMDVGEIRAAFALSEALPERIKNFRSHRLSEVTSGGTPVPLTAGPKLILHLLPLSAFSTGSHLDPVAMKMQNQRLRPIGRDMGLVSRFNVDGVVIYASYPAGAAGSSGYCQTFRTGAIEAVDMNVFEEYDDRKFISDINYERGLIQAVSDYLEALRELEVQSPVVIMASMIGVAGCEMTTPLRQRTKVMEPTTMDRDVILLPDVLVEAYGCEVPRLLRPIFDATWNAAGWEGSPNYNEQGNWSTTR